MTLLVASRRGPFPSPLENTLLPFRTADSLHNLVTPRLASIRLLPRAVSSYCALGRYQAWTQSKFQVQTRSAQRNPASQSSAVGIAADRAAINAAISTAGSRHSRAGFDLIKRLRSFLPAPAEKGLAVSLLIVSSLLFFTSQHASTLRSYGSCPFFDAEREAAELKSSRQVSVGIHLWRASADHRPRFAVYYRLAKIVLSSAKLNGSVQIQLKARRQFNIHATLKTTPTRTANLTKLRLKIYANTLIQILVDSKRPKAQNTAQVYLITNLPSAAGEDSELYASERSWTGCSVAKLSADRPVSTVIAIHSDLSRR
ncbi:hypothetical protein C8R45DRAFT_923275 [Mycena sanguinolenta]|nr:hypothetical protein C8R45DRAFT_923275 [Mycena sanguinolenta]